MKCRVVQSTWGTFHHLDLAVQLHRQDMLEIVFSSFPRWKLRRWGLPDEKVRSTTWLHAALVAKWKLLGPTEWLDRGVSRLLIKMHSRYLVRHIPYCDVLVALSGSGLEAGRLVQSRGGKYVCDRGSSHIRYSAQILREEFERWGQTYQGSDPQDMAREEEEYATADAIVVPSEFARRSFVEMGVPAAKVRQIPLGVDLGRFRRSGSPLRDRFEVLFVGQISFRKGVPYLLQAFAQVKHPCKRLRIVGAMLPEMQEYLRGRPQDHVEFLGTVPQDDLALIMSSSHVLVLPSIEDGFGMVLSQAMACGCPIICSTNTGGKELLPETDRAFIVPIRDAQAITDKLERFCQEPDLYAKLSKKVQEIVLGLGGWDDYGAKSGAFYREITQKSDRALLQSSTPSLVE